MDVLTLIAMIVFIPVILFPACFVWYLNVGGLIAWQRKRNPKLVKDLVKTVS